MRLTYFKAIPAFFLACSMAIMAEQSRDMVKPRMSWLDNGTLRLGVDLAIGGAITYLAESDKKINMINSYDWGRQIQMSFYSGPSPFVPDGAEVHTAWKQLGWNPIQSGDCYNYPSEVVEHRNDGNTIYVKCIPKHWPLKNVPGQCFFECWFKLEKNTVAARSKLTNHRNDKTQYAGRSQELPAVYSNGPWYKVVTYVGDKPFTGADPTVIVDKADGKGWPWRMWATPEHWCALLDGNDHGIGLHLPGACAFTGGFAGGDGNKGKGGPKDSPTGYMTARHLEILDHNIAYDYAYTLIVGSLQEIRNHVYSKSVPGKLPSWNFSSDRQHWHYAGTTDAGWPINDCLEVELNPQAVARVISPTTFWKAEDAPVFAIKASFETDATSGHIALMPFEESDKKDWPQWGDVKRPPRAPAIHVPFNMIGDGKVRSIEIDLCKADAYKGTMTQVQILLPKAKGSAKIYSIEFRSSGAMP